MQGKRDYTFAITLIILFAIYYFTRFVVLLLVMGLLCALIFYKKLPGKIVIFVIGLLLLFRLLAYFVGYRYLPF